MVTTADSRHHKTHVRPHACDECGKKFALKADLERHRISRHRSENLPGYQCRWPSCTQRPYQRSDQLRRHIRATHEKSRDLKVKRLPAESEALYEQSVREQRMQSNSSLLLAAESGSWSMVRLLVNQGANIDMRSRNGHTALYFAVGWNDRNAVQFLLDAGADIGSEFQFRGVERDLPLIGIYPSRKSYTVLDIASDRGHLDLVKLLLAYETPPKRSQSAQSTLFWASTSRHENVVKFLLEISANSQRSGIYEDVLVTASHMGYHGIMRLLIAAGVNVNERGNTDCRAIQAAAYGGNTEAAKLLLDAGADVDLYGEDDGSALQITAMNGSEEMAHLLLEYGADANKLSRLCQSLQTWLRDEMTPWWIGKTIPCWIDKMTPLCAASINGSIEMVKLLIDHGADVNAEDDRYSALTAAVACDRLHAGRILLEHGADPNVGWKPAQVVASERGHTEIMKLLLDFGAEVNIIGKTGDSALLTAINRGNYELVRILLEHGADFNVVNKKANSVLLTAINGGSYELVRILLEHGADLQKLRANGRAALVAAARRGDVKMVELLIDHGVELDETSTLYKNAVQFALEKDYRETLQILRMAVKKPRAEHPATQKGG